MTVLSFTSDGCILRLLLIRGLHNFLYTTTPPINASTVTTTKRIIANAVKAIATPSGILGIQYCSEEPVIGSSGPWVGLVGGIVAVVVGRGGLF